MGRKFAPVRDRMKVYELVQEMTDDERAVGAPAIWKQLKGAGYELPSRQTIQRWISGETSPLIGKRLFTPKPSEEISFFISAWYGDGWGDENDGGKRMLLKVRSFDFTKEFAVSAEKILQKTDSYWVRRVVDSNGAWFLVKVTSFMLYDFVTQPLSVLRSFVELHPRGFLRGIFTAEGNPSVSIYVRRGPGLMVGLSLSNSDKELLELCRVLLSGLGLSPGKIRLATEAGSLTNIGVATKPCWILTLSRFGDIRSFAANIGFADSTKQTKLD